MIILTESTAKETADITRIKKLCYETDAENFNVSWQGPSGYKDVETTLKQLQESRCFSFYDDSQIVGFIELKRLEKHRYLINTVVIDPAYDNKGFTAKALQNLEKLMYTVKTWEVDIPAHSVKNHTFFRRLGYKKSFEFVYNNEIDAVRFVKKM